MSLGHGASIVRDGLVLHLDAANVKSYSGSGTTWNDLSGNGNDGALVNSVGYSTNSNGVLSFDGVNDHINLGNSSELSSIGGTTNITASAWVYYNDYGGGAQGYSVITVKGSPWTWLLENFQQTFRFRITAGGSDVNVPDTSTHELNKWYCVSGTYDGATMNIYVNGDLKAFKSQTGSLATNSVTARIGTFQGTNYNLNGNISDVKIYNRALTAQEIKQNFEALRGRYNISRFYDTLPNIIDGGSSQNNNITSLNPASSAPNSVSTIIDGGSS